MAENPNELRKALRARAQDPEGFFNFSHTTLKAAWASLCIACFDIPNSSSISTEATPMKINPDVFEAYLRCPTKCWLRSTGEPSACNSNPEWVRTQNDSYRKTGMERLLADSPKDEIELSPDMENVKDAKWRLAFSLAVQFQEEFKTTTSKHFISRGGHS